MNTVTCTCRMYPEALVDVVHRPTETRYVRTYIHGNGGIARPARRAILFAENAAERGETLIVYLFHTAELSERVELPASECDVTVFSAGMEAE